MAETWNAVATAVDRDQSGVEILYRCTRHIPPAGVRFTLFQIKDGTVLLVGARDNVSGVVELQNKLDELPALKKAFAALTPGRQRSYIFHFSAPKQSKTRESRVEKCVPQILAGKGLNDQ